LKPVNPFQSQKKLYSLVSSWPEYACIVVKAHPFQNTPVNYPGLGPGYSWIPVNTYSVQRIEGASPASYDLHFKVPSGIWNQSFLQVDRYNRFLTIDFHFKSAPGATNEIFIQNAQFKSVKWVWEDGPQPGLYLDIHTTAEGYDVN